VAGLADRYQAKKLEDAARHWAGGGVKDETSDDLAVMGAAPEIAQAMQETSPTHDFEVLEENWQAVSMFMRLQTQWVPMMGGVAGLNYQSVEFLFRIEGIENQREMLADLQAMEIAALQVMNVKD
jgi:hypothetical protein